MEKPKSKNARKIAVISVCVFLAVSILFLFVRLSLGFFTIAVVDPVKFYKANESFLNNYVAMIKAEKQSYFEDEYGHMKIPQEISKEIKDGYIFRTRDVMIIEFKTSGWAAGNHTTLIYKSNGEDLTQAEMRFEQATCKRINGNWFAVNWND